MIGEAPRELLEKVVNLLAALRGQTRNGSRQVLAVVVGRLHGLQHDHFTPQDRRFTPDEPGALASSDRRRIVA
jgi:hypothetical protein